MLCARLPGYKEALGEVSTELVKATDPKELFAALFTSPLQKVKSPEKPLLIILDALDELPITCSVRCLRSVIPENSSGGSL